MSDLKFNIDQPELPEDRINKHKDFKKLMYNYQSATKPLYKTPLYKNRKVFLIILLILLVMFVIVEVIEKDETPVPVNTQQPK
ncbi:MAG: hypothetical protein JWO44_658 [Bacteroidetes bacterium]|jgi:hypothetical protein|nr:hypothetical protein [Bacteroidota bacterium]